LKPQNSKERNYERTLKNCVGERSNEEIVSDIYNPEVLKYAREQKISGFTSNEVEWCGIF
jgi:hypothetical protein